MTDRERTLSILVGGVIAIAIVWWGYGKYAKAVKFREDQITNLENKQQQLNEQLMLGERANRQMGEYVVRSLPGDSERAQSQYQQWLLEIVEENQLAGGLVDANSTRKIADLYQLLDFRVRGNADVPTLIRVLHAFYSKDYLHRIRDISIRETRDGDFQVEMSIDAIALLSAPVDLPARENPSWRVDGDLAAYLDPIMNRNLYEPPNQAPKYTGSETIEAFVGRRSPSELVFKDPEGHDVRFEIVEPSEDLKELVSVNERTGTLTVNSDEKQEFDITVRAIDSGYPRRTVEKKLTVKVVDPPVEAKPEPKLAFDDATQTVLTALVQGRNEWTAWMHVRTRDTTLRLRVGDAFEIGSLKGKVVEVTPRFVMLEIDGSRFELRPSGNLSEAAKSADGT